MASSNNKQSTNAALFAKKWAGRGYEKGESQPFWLELLQKVLGVDDPYSIISFEKQVNLSHTSFIDGYIGPTKVLIEQKSVDKDLREPVKQSDGTLLTPYQQAKRYATELPYSKYPRYVVTCNFRSFLIYDMEQPGGNPQEVLLENLEKDYKKLEFMVDDYKSLLKHQEQVSIEAGRLVGRMYNAILSQYIDPESEESLRSLNILCVRIVFCLYAEDAGIFGAPNMFHDYIMQFDAGKMRQALYDLFLVLDTPKDKRDPYIDPSLNQFPYVAGGLFSDKNITIPRFTDDLRTLILDRASEGFDWSQISPTIFGAVFESTLNPETRRKGGMHYTSVENIHKVIDPLFLNDLKAEFAAIKMEDSDKKRRVKLLEFQNKLASLTFLDPACGSGNFLTETYLSLRRLENEAILMLNDYQMVLGVLADPIKVSIRQFYGIEINDFAVTVAATALWIAECQMIAETEKIGQFNIEPLPLKAYSNIREGNALRTDWNEVVSKENLTYILGNPPFVGARLKEKEQAEDLEMVFGKKWKNLGNMDYVCGWYKKAADMIKGTDIRCAFVSTNSITQGEQVAALWAPLMNDGIVIDFAWRTFTWDSEATQKAHVYCVIVGFSTVGQKDKVIYDKDGVARKAANINGYLVDGPSIAVDSISKPLCDIPAIGIGNKPIDNGNYLFTPDEKDEFIKQEPAAAAFFRPWLGAEEFINRKVRYCLWLGECPVSTLIKMPNCLERVNAVRDFRLKSKSKQTQDLAEKPTRFHVENRPEGTYIIIPSTSSERRHYIPIGFLTPDVLASNATHIIPNASLYHFGVLTSSVHMMWMRAVCGRLKSDYRYSKDIVYNNFPWPECDEATKAKITATAEQILKARELYPDCSFAELYGENMYLFSDLYHAHQANDKLVMEAYGFSADMTEEEIVSRLLKLYQALL